MLRHAFFPDFESGPKVVLWGEAADMQRLIDVFAAAANDEGSSYLSDLLDCVSVDGSVIEIETLPEPTGMKRDSADPSLFHWGVDQDGWYAFVEQLEPLTRCSSQKPGHQYLRCLADSEITVIVSCGEYPDDMKPDTL